MIEYVDVHCHAYGFKLLDLMKFTEAGVAIIGVAEDYESSLKVLQYAKELKNFFPAVGIHPWNIDKIKEEDVEEVLKLAKDVRILGEIGLDKKFVPDTFEKQKPIFERFVEFAAEHDLALNLHAPNAWEDVLKIITDKGIRRANFHWYTGPLNLLKEIEAQGYFISINPAIRIQKKHARVVEKADPSIILTESDGPYNYRNMFLSPDMIPQTVEEIATLKEMEVKDIKRVILENFKRYIGVSSL